MKLWLFAIVLVLSVINSIDANTIRPLSLPECIQLDSPQQVNRLIAYLYDYNHFYFNLI